jgi:HlyD family secretion protein
MSMNSNASLNSRASIRRHVIIGCALVAFLAVGLGGWASTAEISGALIAQGSLVVDSNVKKVQHPSGGVVGRCGCATATGSRRAIFSFASTKP